MPLSDAQKTASVCYLETIGRVSGQPHEIEIWFATADGQTLYLLSGGGEKADWVRNLQANPLVRVRFGTEWFTGTAREIAGTDAELPARQLVAAKYYEWQDGPLPNEWSEVALPIAITLA